MLPEESTKKAMSALELHLSVTDNAKNGSHISQNLLVEIYDNRGKITSPSNCVDSRSSPFFLGFGICTGVETLRVEVYTTITFCLKGSDGCFKKSNYSSLPSYLIKLWGPETIQVMGWVFMLSRVFERSLER